MLSDQTKPFRDNDDISAAPPLWSYHNHPIFNHGEFAVAKAILIAPLQANCSSAVLETAIMFPTLNYCALGDVSLFHKKMLYELLIIRQYMLKTTKLC